MMPECSIIIPTFNAAALLDRCLEVIFAHPPAVSHEVIVVDDGSTDDTFRVLAERGDAVRVVDNPENAGFAVACNAGAAASEAGWLVFLNNDTRPHPGWLDALTSYAATHPEAAALGAKLLYPDGAVQHAGVVFCQDGYPRHLYAGFPSDHPAVNRARRLQAVTAACILVRRDAFDRVGGFDEGYRNGFEDVDLCLRLGEAGSEIHYCPECVVEHLESVSEGRFGHDRDNVRRYREQWSEHVRPDDVDQYLADGLIRFAYESAYPHALDVAPELAFFDPGSRTGDVEAILAARSRQVRALLGEATRLMARVAHLELGIPPEASTTDGDTRLTGAGADVTPSGTGDPDPRTELRRDEALESRLLALEEAVACSRAGPLGEVPAFVAGSDLRHRAEVRRARSLADSSVPRGAALLVVSHGDPELVAVEGARATHFPQTGDGVYAGHHPASSEEAISQLEALRGRGEGDYLLIPDNARWWFEKYPDFHEHLERYYRTIADDAAGVIYRLTTGDRTSSAARASTAHERTVQDEGRVTSAGSY
jgi:GT2 family glycosyltransferase